MAAASALSVLALGACGGGTGAGSAGGDSGADGSDDGGTTIKLVAAEYSASNTKAFWDAFATTYNETTGNTLEVQIISWDNIDQQTSTMIQNNHAPDILNLNVYASYAADGLLYGADEVLPPEVQDDILDTFVDYGTYEGTLYGFPDLASARALFYNADLFDQAGIDGPPTTWEELKADAGPSPTSATAPSGMPSRSARTRPRASSRCGSTTTAARGRRTVPGPSTAHRTSRRWSSSRRWPMRA